MENAKKEVMCLQLPERKRVIAEAAARYRRSNKKQKRVILDELVPLTGLGRGYLTWALRNHGRNFYVNSGGKTTLFKADIRRRRVGHRPREYDPTILEKPLAQLWASSRFLCGKRLKVFLSLHLPALAGRSGLSLSPEVSAALAKASSATLDRLLARHKRRVKLRGTSLTRPAHLFMKQIPIRTSFDKTVAPGFLEVDLVGHDGGLARGEFCYTLTVTDPATGWTWVKGLLNKAQRWVIQGMTEAIEHYPLPVRGIHSDSGSEFMNRYFREFCESRGIEFTRSRPGRKNDNCHVEQKNDAVVRNTVGYFRLSGPKDLERLNEVYVWVNQSVNFLEPSMKQKEKVRVGSKIRKQYFPPQTPFQRMLICPELVEPERTTLCQRQKEIDFVQVAQNRKKALQSLLRLTKRARDLE